MSKSNAAYNKPRLLELLNELDLEHYELNEHQIRVMGATHILDIWPARMTCHRIGGEEITSKEEYFRLKYFFDYDQVKKLLETGEH